MATFKIPSEYQSGFKKLVALEEEPMQDLLSALREEPPALYPPELSRRVASRVDTIPRDDVNDIVEVLVSLYLLRARHESSIPETAEDICQAMDRSGIEELKLSGEEREHFKERLIELLDVQSVDIGSKAVEVLFENERSLQSARVVTDIRPIFGSDADDPMAGAVIVHMLKLTYFEQNELRSFFVALDAQDVDTLREVLDRAHSKAENLRSFLAATEIPYVDS